MKLLEYMKNNILYLDGGMGTLLQAKGLKPGVLPETWNISHPEEIIEIHKSYYDSGSNVVTMNTFGANCLKFSDKELNDIVTAAYENVLEAKKQSRGTQEKFIALDIGPMGRLLKPYGDMDFEEAVGVYAKTVKIGASLGIDLIIIETMNDSLDTKAALLAAKENSTLPVFVSNAYGEDGKLMTGASPAAMVALLEGMHADAIGANCSLGPKQLENVINEYLKYSSIPVMLQPNAGLPRSENGKTVYDVLPEEFSDDMVSYIESGVRIAGGCCGTTPEYIKKVIDKTKKYSPIALSDKNKTLASSYTHVVEFGDDPILIGERINPTGKKRLKEALKNNDIDYILGLGIDQQERGVHILDVNVGLPEIDEVKMLKKVSHELQAIIDLPLQIDTSDSEAMAQALRQYNGKAIVNSVSGKQHVMDEIFPLVKKYGGLVVCLTLDDEGIPDNAKKRIEIAEKIIRVAESYGIPKKDLIFDTLTMPVSADKNAAFATLTALRHIRYELGCHTILGVSNISFGLPEREVITASFFTMALENGLSGAIMNPNIGEMMQSYYSFRALRGLDENCGSYIEKIEDYKKLSAKASGPEQKSENNNSDLLPDLGRAIVKGLKEQATHITAELLKTKAPLDIVNELVIPALDIVGQGFENKTMYLPQLLMSAEAAQCAFEEIKAAMENDSGDTVTKGSIIVATVHGDIHDIGKNIVKLLLENYGFNVIDLGKDVPPEEICEAVKENRISIVGLSALMTTTVPAMEATIKMLRDEAPNTKIIVGGAVLTKEYSKSIGADFYAKDAMATVRYATEIAQQ